MRKFTLVLSISILLHLLLLASVVFVWQPSFVQQKPPSMYVPSYTYQEPKVSQPAAQEASQMAAAKPTEKEPLKKPDIAEKVIPLAKAKSKSQQFQKPTSYAKAHQTKVNEAIHLVGDKDTVPQPLIKILGKALTANLTYPKIAVDFRLRGTAYVGFILHPDGMVSDVEVVESSNAGVLDSEAARAVRAISPLKNISEYVSKDKPMVIGIIFN